MLPLLAVLWALGAVRAATTTATTATSSTTLPHPPRCSTLGATCGTCVLIPKDSPLAAVLRADPHWQRLFAGDVEEVFGRTGAARPADASS